MNVPVLIVPVLNRLDLTERMLASLDIEVERTIIIDNSRDGAASEGLEATRMYRNLGVSASWNLGMRLSPEAPWWFITNNDIAFAPGDLDRLARYMAEHPADIGMLQTPSAWGISRHALQAIGYFDENFHPAYFEDNDYVHRANLAGVHIEPLPAGLSHQTSSSISSDQRAHEENNRTFPLNCLYYIEKWGGMPGMERWTTPFARGGSIRDWHLDIDRLKTLSWRI